MSKEDEDKRQNESESIQNQKTLLVRYAVEQGWDIYRIYCDEDYSGADSLRPDFNRMLEAAEEKSFQIILCMREKFILHCIIVLLNVYANQHRKLQAILC